MQKSVSKPISIKDPTKKAFMFGEAIIAFALFMSMIILLLGNQAQEIQKLRASEDKLAQTREIFQQVNARQYGVSLHTGVFVDFEKGEVEDMRNGQFKQIQISSFLAGTGE
ncbi:hypothetical protein [Aerococcus sp. 1KP-2016]|uniref:hypothetical protein n=1 Tax=Aerococcus sp. 1KP-2016 TaxID=1981982 RepID=UPI000B99CBC4|nr:hypothetical protein [Aerococcus sp. 1KP-2016]OYQ66784.1 hypothetical protein B9P78_05140 [Aerococcus sp. 1KP-2016]